VSVLIIEDDQPFVELLRHWVGGREIRVAPTLEAARRMIAEAAPKFMILDLGLPDSTTVQTLARIRELKRQACDATVIVITGHPDTRERALTEGADRFLHKDEKGDGFFSAISSALVEGGATPKCAAEPTVAEVERTVQRMVQP
jgi:DNA-binding response OmpR family regulator